MSDPEIRQIVLAGRKWDIPFLTLRQNRKLQPLFQKISSSILSGDIKTTDLSEEHIDDLTQIVLIALSKNYPNITPAELDGMPIGLSELIGAVLPIMTQSKLFGSAAPGENGAEASRQTGTE